jgi:hypothetical protein
MRKGVLTLEDRRLAARAVLSVHELVMLDDIWTAYLGEPGSISTRDRVQLGALGYELLSAIHDVQAHLAEWKQALSKVNVGDVKKEVARVLRDDQITPGRLSQVLAKFDKCAASHQGWEPFLRSLNDRFDKEASVIRAKLTKIHSGKATKGDIGRAACCGLGFALCGAGFALRSVALIRAGGAMVFKCC